MNPTPSIQSLYFLGIGGIGMSALARYFASRGCHVEGYDRTPSPLTHELEDEGISIVYSDSPQTVSIKPQVVVWTPAVPKETALYQYFQEQGIPIVKRSEMLGEITDNMRALCVAGTHGKTSTSALLAHILRPQGINAFLGGISMNIGSNLLITNDSDRVVVEADEFDRSFLHLSPTMTAITAIDPDHLDIYGTKQGYQEGFEEYARLVKEAIVIRKGYHVTGNGKAEIYTYSVGEPADFYADNVRVNEGKLFFDWHSPSGTIADVELGVPVLYDVENATVAMALAHLEGVSEKCLREGVRSYQGVWRRFNVLVQTPYVTYIDDYAHHPQELQTAIASARLLYPHRHLTGIFQPHLYTRTRDFMDGFAEALSKLDEVILLPVYPAREMPIEGITSEILAKKIVSRYPVRVVQKEDLIRLVSERVKAFEETTIMTLGAGDIDRLVGEMATQLNKM